MQKWEYLVVPLEEVKKLKKDARRPSAKPPESTRQ